MLVKGTVIGLFLLTLLSGCEREAIDAREGTVGIHHWNESNRGLRIVFELGYGLPESQPVEDPFPHSERSSGGNIGFTCFGHSENPADQPLPMRITLKGVDSTQKWSYDWSDIGCGTYYDFVYHADGTAQLKLRSKASEITRDVPIK